MLTLHLLSYSNKSYHHSQHHHFSRYHEPPAKHLFAKQSETWLATIAAFVHSDFNVQRIIGILVDHAGDAIIEDAVIAGDADEGQECAVRQRNGREGRERVGRRIGRVRMGWGWGS